MKRSSRHMIVLMLSLLLAIPAMVAAEGEPATAEQNLLEIGLGYRGLGIDGGGETLLPYENLESAPQAELNALLFFPWQAALAFEGNYYGDSYYQVWGDFHYRSDLDFNVGSTEFVHNREHAVLFGDAGAGIPASDLNPDDHYSVDINETTANLKLRVPSYPAHVNLGARRFNVEGNRQQVFEDWSCTTRCHVVSRTRSVDTTTDQITAGADAHLGLFDVSYSFKGTSFKDSEPNPEWRYGPLFGVRNTRNMFLNTYPDISASSQSISLSTSNTGRVAAAFAYQFGQRKNDDTDLTDMYRNGGGTVVLRPHQTVALSFRYYHRQRDEDASDEVAALRIAGALPVEYQVTEDYYSGTVNCYPFKGLQLNGSYAYKTIDRDDAEAWGLPERSVNRTWKIGARAKPMRQVNLDVYYQRQDNDDPETTLVPTTRTDGYAGLNVQPWSTVLLQASFHSTTADNDSSYFSTATYDLPTNRHSERQTMQTGLTVTPHQRLNLGLFYVMFKEDVTQDLLLGTPSLVLIPFSGVPYHSRGDEILFQGKWKPLDLLELTADASWLEADGHMNIYSPPFHDIDEFSRFDATQWRFGLAGDVGVGRGWSLMTRLGYASYDDQVSSDNDETVREITVMARKRW